MAQPATLTGTMAGPNLAQPTADDTITNEYKRLQDMMSQMPDIDFQAKFGSMIDQAKAKPIPQAPGGISTFAAAMGNAGMTHQNLQSRLSEIEKAKSTKNDEIMNLQLEALRGDIDQQMQKGKFKQALAQSEVMAKMQASLDQAKREQVLADKLKLQEDLFGKKDTLAKNNASRAENLVRTKAREYAKSMGFDEKLTLKLMELVSEPAMAVLRASISRNPLTGEQDMDAESMQEGARAVESLIQRLGETLRNQQKERDGDGKTTPTSKDDPLKLGL